MEMWKVRGMARGYEEVVLEIEALQLLGKSRSKQKYCTLQWASGALISFSEKLATLLKHGLQNREKYSVAFHFTSCMCLCMTTFHSFGKEVGCVH